MKSAGNDTTVLELLVPGLLGPVPPSPQAPPKTPVLDRLLARGRPTDSLGGDLTAALLERFGVDASAPYCLAADDPEWDRAGFWMHADPVHLRPDRDLLRLFDARHLVIGQDEAAALVAAFNAHFAADGLWLVAPAASRWYLRCDSAPALQTQPLAAVIGQHIDGFLPVGADAPRWASLMNEAQMLLFQSPVNRRREAAGQPAVNGLWTWGGGLWRPPTAADPPDRVLGDMPLARGLALAAGIPLRGDDGPGLVEVGELAKLLDPAEAPGRVLAIWQGLQEALLAQDEAAWAQAAEALDRALQPALAAMRAGRLARIELDVCDGRRWSIRPGDLRRFRIGWPRRPRTLAERAAAPEI
ncbi:phosphoglycerate mutase [Thiohalocapsa marina]|uniref:Phosphoglycerate mutase n=1 Tax=Thiohalocapsa marina TaxID=424902 RepID=A0A5M8FIL3_9GAMM|nr:phosphoglycerate mutase [Thiohalocapsa marina]KAA6183586.1 phosphoglycerate mutase [Thiohalocapsa marina]